MTALTVYLTNVATSSLASAASLATATGGTITGDSTHIGTSTGYGQIYGLGNGGAWAAAGSIGLPDGNGWLWDVNTLEGNTIAAGTYTPTIRIRISSGTATADLYVAYFKYNTVSGVYTSIGTVSTTGLALTTLFQTPTFSASLPAMAFGTNEKLYMHVWPNITANSTGSSLATIFITTTTSSSQGDSTGAQTTPGYSTSPVALAVTMSGVGTLSGSLSVDAHLAVTMAGVGTFTPTLYISGGILTVTMSGVGTLSGTISLVGVALAVTMSGVGTFTPTLSVNVYLAVEMDGVGTATFGLIGGTAAVALTATISGVGTLTAVLSGGIAALIPAVAGHTIFATDFTQVISILQRSSGQVEKGKWVVAGNGLAAAGARIAVFIYTLSGTSVPVSASIDTFDVGTPSTMAAPILDQVTQAGFQVRSGVSTASAGTGVKSGTVAGNYNLQF